MKCIIKPCHNSFNDFGIRNFEELKKVIFNCILVGGWIYLCDPKAPLRNLHGIERYCWYIPDYAISIVDDMAIKKLKEMGYAEIIY